ncbi:MAG: ATP-binding protein [Bdellovibrionota bacterium]
MKTRSPQPRSFQSRFLLISSAVFVIFVLLMTALIERSYFYTLRSNLRTSMENQIYSLIGSIDYHDHEVETGNEVFLNPDFFDDAIKRYAYVLDSQGKVLWESSKISSQIIDPSDLHINEWLFKRDHSQDGFSFVLAHQVEWIQSAQQTQTLTLVVYETPTEFQRYLRKFRHILWILLPAMGFLVILIQVVLIRWGLKPINTMGEQIKLVTQGSQEKILGSYTRELETLKQSINHLIEYEHIQYQQIKQSLRNIAHSLKTPSAVIETIIEKEDFDSSKKQAMQDQMNKIRSTVDYYLHRASLERKRLFVAPLRIHPLLTSLLSGLQKLYESKGIHLTWDCKEETHVSMEKEDFMECFGNLIENAFKYCTSKISVRVENKEHQAFFVIEDDGPGISETLKEKIFQRGFRIDESVEGQGLGLSIAYELIQTYRGSIEVSSSQTWGGLCLRISIPSSHKI